MSARPAEAPQLGLFDGLGLTAAERPDLPREPAPRDAVLEALPALGAWDAAFRAIEELTGSSTVVASVRRILRDIEVAEEEIHRAIEEHPERREEVWASFLLMQPRFPMPELAYRAHCRELLARVLERRTGKLLEEGTDAEIVVACSESSKIAPFNAVGGLLYWRTFRRLFPAEAEKVRAAGGGDEPFPTSRWLEEEADALERGLRRKQSGPRGP